MMYDGQEFQSTHRPKKSNTSTKASLHPYQREKFWEKQVEIIKSRGNLSDNGVKIWSDFKERVLSENNPQWKKVK